jgi:predicted component of type VI protein secretion system
MPSHLLRYHGTDTKLPDDRTIVIGRDPTCDIVVNDPGASRRHCSLKVEPEGVWLEDLGSQNGVFVNGAKVDKPVCLKTGDWFRVGRDEFAVRVVWDRSRGHITAEEPVTHSGPVPKPTTSTTQAMRAAAAAEGEGFGRDKTATAAPGLPPGFVRPAPARVPMTTMSFSAGQLDPVASVKQSCRNALADAGLPVLDRVNGALHLVQALVDMQADSDACTLLGETLDVLRKSQAAGILPPLAAARAHAFLGRWWSQLAGEPEWQERFEALRRAERL